jgi:hypothetical protein
MPPLPGGRDHMCLGCQQVVPALALEIPTKYYATTNHAGYVFASFSASFASASRSTHASSPCSCAHRPTCSTWTPCLTLG